MHDSQVRIRLAGRLLAALSIVAAAPAGAVTADYARTPVLLIHGYFVLDQAGDFTWANFTKRMIEDGWPEEYLATPSFDDVRGCNEDHVEEIEAWVDDLTARTGFEKIDIVCHSFGCLNTVTWLKERCGMNRVRQYVGLAGAVHGTIVACADDFVGLSCAGHQMCIDLGDDGWKTNDLIVSVNACDETPGDVGYTCVWTGTDEIIIPPSGSKLAGCNNIKVQTFGIGHGGIFMADESYGYLKEALLGAGGSNDDGPSWDCTPQCMPPAVADPAPEAGPDEPTAADDASTADEGKVADTVTGDGAGPADARADETIVADPGPAPDPGTGRDASPDAATTDADRLDAAPAADDDAGTPPSRSSSGCSNGGGPVGPSALAPAGLLLLGLATLGRTSTRNRRARRPA